MKYFIIFIVIVFLAGCAGYFYKPADESPIMIFETESQCKSGMQENLNTYCRGNKLYIRDK